VKPHRSLRALLVDVPPAHGRLLERTLAEAGWQMDGEHAEGADRLTTALQRRDWDAVLYAGDGPGAVPARKALALVRLADPHLPFLAVSPWVRDPAQLPAALARALDASRLRRRVGGAHRLLLAQQAITDAIAAGLAPDELAGRVLATLGDTLGWSCGVVWRPAADGMLRCAGTWHAQTNREIGVLAELSAETSFAPGQGLPGRVYAFRRPSWVRDVGRDGGGDPRAAQARRAGLMTSLAFPIAHGDRCAGVIEFFSRGIARPNAEVSAMFATVGHQLAQVLERAQDREQAAEHQAADAARRLLDATGAFVAVLDGARRIRLAGTRTCDALDRPEADLLGQDWLEAAVPPAVRQDAAAALAVAAAGNGPAQIEHPLGDPGDGVVRWRAARVEGAGDLLVLLTGT
jgi:PAS domain-containing protein